MSARRIVIAARLRARCSRGARSASQWMRTARMTLTKSCPR
jgi:hypothetical protein